MYPILFSAFITASVYLLHAWGKCKQKTYVYLLLFCGLVTIDYIYDYTWKAHAHETCLETHMFLRAKHENEDKKKKLNRREIHENYLKVCKEQVEYHREQALKSYEEAEKICVLFPNIDDREKAKWCLTSAFAAALPATPTYRILAAALILLEQYYSEMVSEWQRLDTKLHQAKSHAEMYEHYRQLEKYTERQVELEKNSTTTKIIFN